MGSLLIRCAAVVCATVVLALAGGGLTALAQTPPSPQASPSPPYQACPTDPVLGTGCALGKIGDLASAIHDFASNPAGAIGKWIVNSITGSSDGTDFMGQLLSGTPDLGGGTFSQIWSMFLGAAWAVFGIALVLRLLKQAAMESGRGQHPLNLLIDMGPRLLIFPAAAGVSFAVISALAGVSRDIGAAIFAGIASMAGPKIVAAGGIDKAVMQMANPGLSPSSLLQAVAGIVMVCLLLYLVMLMAMRFVSLSFGIAIAPVAIMCGAYDTSNAVFQWWFRSIVGSLLVPVILGAIGGMTLVLALVPFATATGGGILAADVFMIGGLWFMGKTVHHATLGAYQHHHFSAMLGAAEAGMLAWTRPMSWHKSVPGVQSAMRAAGSGGAASRGLQVAAGGGRTIGAAAGSGVAESLLQDRAPFRNGFKNAVANDGILIDEVEGAAATAGMGSLTPVRDKVDAYLAVPGNANKVYSTLYPEWSTTNRIDANDPNNTTGMINQRYAASHPAVQVPVGPPSDRGDGEPPALARPAREFVGASTHGDV